MSIARKSWCAARNSRFVNEFPPTSCLPPGPMRWTNKKASPVCEAEIVIGISRTFRQTSAVCTRLAEGPPASAPSSTLAKASAARIVRRASLKVTTAGRRIILRGSGNLPSAGPGGRAYRTCRLRAISPGTKPAVAIHSLRICETLPVILKRTAAGIFGIRRSRCKHRCHRDRCRRGKSELRHITALVSDRFHMRHRDCIYSHKHAIRIFFPLQH